MNRSTAHHTRVRTCWAFGALALLAGPLAAGAPDAGQTLQPLRAPNAPPALRPSGRLTGPETAPSPPEGPDERVQLREIVFVGHSAIDTAALQELVADVIGRSLSFRELHNLAERVTRLYRDAGYPVARARLPAQEIVEGRLTIEVVEGRLGDVQAVDANGEPVDGAQGFLAPLQPGAVIDERTLTRALQLLDEQPGYRSTAVVRPGVRTGTGDLRVVLEQTPTPTLDTGFDNHGNRYTGRERVRLDFAADSPFRFGDRLTITALVSGRQGPGNIRFGLIGYQWPLNSDGLVAQVRHASSRYRLGQEFTPLDSSGTAKATELALSHAWLRERELRATLTVRLAHKSLRDAAGATGDPAARTVWSVPVTLQAERADAFGGGGQTQGNLTLTHGRVRTSASTHRTSASFFKLEASVARTQRLTDHLGAFVQFATQRADRRLDSSEGLDVSGPHAVRAFPGGDTFGDQGWFVRTELQWYPAPDWTAFLLRDEGALERSHAQSEGSPARRIAGHGIGLRYSGSAHSVEATLAWPLRRGTTTDPKEAIAGPRLWLRVHRRFD